MSDCCEYGDEPTDSIEDGEFVDQLCDSQLMYLEKLLSRGRVIIQIQGFPSCFFKF